MGRPDTSQIPNSPVLLYGFLYGFLSLASRRFPFFQIFYVFKPPLPPTFFCFTVRPQQLGPPRVRHRVFPRVGVMYRGWGFLSSLDVRHWRIEGSEIAH